MPRHLNLSACHTPPPHRVNKATKAPCTTPLKPKDVLDIRIVPGDPNNAWIECYQNTYDEDAMVGVAEVSIRSPICYVNFL